MNLEVNIVEFFLEENSKIIFRYEVVYIKEMKLNRYFIKSKEK